MDSFRWGILGAARIARRLIPAIREAGGEVVALGVRDPASERARTFAQEWGVPIVGGYAEVIAGPVDAVYNPLPNDLHAPWTLAALRAGKHALTEKPLSLNEAEARALAVAAGEAGRVLLEAFAPPFHPYMRRVRELSQGGELGEVRALHASFGFDLTRPDDFRWNAAQGGGALYDVGTYAVHLARQLLGEPSGATGWARWTGTEGGVDLGFSGVLDYPGALVTVAAGFDWPAPAQRLSVVGSEGTLDADCVASGGDRPVALRLSTRTGTRREEVPAANAYAEMVAHFQRVAQGEEVPRRPPEDAVGQARVLDALYASARSGRRVSLG